VVIQSRRNFLIGAVASLIAAPAIVRAGSLMPVKVMPELPSVFEAFTYNAEWTEIRLGYAITREAINRNLYVPLELLR